MRFDVAVIGSGPAGLALARACGSRGLSVVVVAPEPERPWEANYAAWCDEVTDPALFETFETTWAAPGVWLDDVSGERILDRRYARFSTRALQSVLLEGVGGVTFERAVVQQIEHHDLGATLRLGDHREIEAAVAVDVSGASSRFLERNSEGAPAWQVAYGQVLEVAEHPWFEGEMVLMDWRSVPGWHEREPPTFLYVLPLGKHVVFVEETSLASRPAVPTPFLRSRLEQRLHAADIRVRRVISEERCRIPMGLAIPRRDQRTLGFGVAASKVHPATGYQLARSLSESPALAHAIANGLDSGGPARASALGWQTLWPRDALLQWELYTFGLNFLCTLGVNETRAFFAAFFALDTPVWRGFLSGTLGVAGVAKAMGQIFSHLEAPLRWELMRAGASAKSVPFVKAALAS